MLERVDHCKSKCFVEGCGEQSTLAYKIDGKYWLPVCKDHDARLRVEMIRLLDNVSSTHYSGGKSSYHRPGTSTRDRRI